MRIVQVLFILLQLPVTVVFRRRDQTAYLLYLIGWDGKASKTEVKYSHHNLQAYSSFTEIDEDIKRSEYLTARVT